MPSQVHVQILDEALEPNAWMNEVDAPDDTAPIAQLTAVEGGMLGARAL